MKNRMKEAVDSKSYIIPLVIGAFLQALPVCFISQGVAVAVCTLICPLLFIISERRIVKKSEWFMFAGLMLLSQYIRFIGLFGLKPILMLGTLLGLIVFVLLESFAYILDHILLKLRMFVLQFIFFPAMFTMACYLFCLIGCGNLCNPVTTIAYIPFLAEITSVISEYGLTFAYMWLASMMAFVLDGREKNKKPFYIGVSALLIIVWLGFGLIRSSEINEEKSTIRMAFCTTYAEDFDSNDSLYGMDEHLELIEEQLNAAAEQNADMAVFVEEHTSIDEKNLESSLDEISSLVCEYNMYVLLPVAVMTEENEKNINECILFNPSGEIELTYVKNNLVPFVEKNSFARGEGSVGETEIVINGQQIHIAIAICFDTCNSLFVRGMTSDANILICPSWEWNNCNYEQLRNASLRAIENDVTVVKATQDGFHTIVNPEGKILYQHLTIGEYGSVEVEDVPIYEKQQEHVLQIDNVCTAELVCIAMLGVLLYAMLIQWKILDERSKLFIVCLCTGIMGIIADTASYAFDGFGLYDGLLSTINLLAFLFVDVTMISFAFYFKSLLSSIKKIKKWNIYVSIILSLLDFSFLMTAFLCGKLFTIENNIYIEGELSYYAGIIPGINLFYLLILTIYNRKYMDEREYRAIVIYMLLPLISSLITLANGTESTMTYVYASFSLLVIFVLLQSNSLIEGKVREELLEEISNKDPLTRLNNRRAFHSCMRDIRSMEKIGVIFSDINGLKFTNDTYGHDEGDKLIIRYADILKNHFRYNEVFRTSGDEFVVIIRKMEEEIFEERMKEYKSVLEKENYIAAVGYAFGRGEDKTKLITEAENKMYADKDCCYEITKMKRR